MRDPRREYAVWTSNWLRISATINAFWATQPPILSYIRSADKDRRRRSPSKPWWVHWNLTTKALYPFLNAVEILHRSWDLCSETIFTSALRYCEDVMRIWILKTDRSFLKGLEDALLDRVQIGFEFSNDGKKSASARFPVSIQKDLVLKELLNNKRKKNIAKSTKYFSFMDVQYIHVEHWVVLFIVTPLLVVSALIANHCQEDWLT